MTWLPDWLGCLTPPLCACLHSLLLESGPWPFFILGIPTNKFACVFVCLPSCSIRCRRACLPPCLTMPSETGEREREMSLAGCLASWPSACKRACLNHHSPFQAQRASLPSHPPGPSEKVRERETSANMVGCPYGWLTGQGNDLALPDWLGRFAPPLCVCLQSLLLESGPWPFFILGSPTNRERKRER